MTHADTASSFSSTPHLTVEPWAIAVPRFDAAQAALHETLFTVGNGQIGVRGAQEEGDIWPGTMQNDVFVNGFYESEPIVYPESAYGFAKNNQFLVRVPNATGIHFALDGVTFDPTAGQITHYQRQLDFQTGVLTRQFTWRAPTGQLLAVQSERVVSFTHQHVVAQRYSVTLMEGQGEIAITSSISNRAKALKAGDDPRVGASLSGQLQFVDFVQGERGDALFTHRTHHSDLQVATAMRNTALCLGTGVPVETGAQNTETANHKATHVLATGQTLTLTKFAAYVTSQQVQPEQIVATAQAALDAAAQLGFEGLQAAQRDYLSAFWQSANVDIGGDDTLQQGMHFSQFHLLQSVGRDGRTNIAAKGVTGAGYDGHYFWDTEIYVLPFFVHTRPEIAQKLLQSRVRMLDDARTRAKEMAHESGALYPWRTITGPECSSYFPAGTAQYHINADIAYALRLYVDVTGDKAFLAEQGAEMLLETARIWPQLGKFDAAGRFGIYTVTGPDEYTAIVNNNLFTNVMARHHLRFAAQTAAWLQADHPAVYAALAAKIGLTIDEVATWQRAADHMMLPYNSALGIHAQDDTFLDKPVWDFANAPKDKYPLLLHYHPLVIYRHQVCKQPDVVLALMLLGDEFDGADQLRNYDYYEAITTHDSSLSSCIFSIMASRLGKTDKAYDYFMQTARLDIDNLHHNTQHGVHAAALAGSWMGVVYGFAGLKSLGGMAHFAPHLPTAWSHYQFVVRLQNSLLQVRVERDATHYQLLEGEALHIEHRGQRLTVQTGSPVRIA